MRSMVEGVSRASAMKARLLGQFLKRARPASHPPPPRCTRSPSPYREDLDERIHPASSRPMITPMPRAKPMAVTGRDCTATPATSA
jgi:hypothetical protein